MPEVKVRLVFDDWRKKGVRASDADCLCLMAGQFHSGTTFPGSIELDEEDAEELLVALRDGFQPVFWVGLPKPVETRDPGSPCNGWKPGPTDRFAQCETDGHYRCRECANRKPEEGTWPPK